MFYTSLMRILKKLLKNRFQRDVFQPLLNVFHCSTNASTVASFHLSPQKPFLFSKTSSWNFFPPHIIFNRHQNLEAHPSSSSTIWDYQIFPRLRSTLSCVQIKSFSPLLVTSSTRRFLEYLLGHVCVTCLSGSRKCSSMKFSHPNGLFPQLFLPQTFSIPCFAFSVYFPVIIIPYTIQTTCFLLFPSRISERAYLMVNHLLWWWFHFHLRGRERAESERGFDFWMHFRDKFVFEMFIIWIWKLVNMRERNTLPHISGRPQKCLSTIYISHLLGMNFGGKQLILAEMVGVWKRSLKFKNYLRWK